MQFSPTLPVAAAVAFLMTPASMGEVIVFDNTALFSSVAQMFGMSVSAQDFSNYDGGYSSGVSGGSGSTAWTATSSTGFLAQGGIFSAFGASDAVTFTFATDDVYAVGGNFFNRDSSFAVLPSIIRVTTDDGVSYVHYVGSTTTFSGFVSTGEAIQSITVAPFGSSGQPAFSAVSSMTFGVVPAPGAIALLAVAGLVSRRRRA